MFKNCSGCSEKWLVSKTSCPAISILPCHAVRKSSLTKCVKSWQVVHFRRTVFCLFCFLPFSQRFIQSPVFYQSVLTRPFLNCTCTTAIICPPQNEVICSVSSRILYGFSQEWTFLLSHDQAVRFQLPRCLMSCKYGSPPPS